MAEHTKGKLHMSPGKRTIDICAAPSIPWVRIAHISGMSPEDIANARRMVACWNACKDIPTHVLEGCKLKLLITSPDPDEETDG